MGFYEGLLQSRLTIFVSLQVGMPSMLQSYYFIRVLSFLTLPACPEGSARCGCRFRGFSLQVEGVQVNRFRFGVHLCVVSTSCTFGSRQQSPLP